MTDELIFGGLIVVFILAIAFVLILALASKTAEVMGDKESAEKLEEAMKKGELSPEEMNRLKRNWIMGPVVAPTHGIGRALWDDDDE